MKLNLAVSILTATVAPSINAFTLYKNHNDGFKAFVGTTRGQQPLPLFGIMDEVNSDAYDLLSSVAKSSGDKQKAAAGAAEGIIGGAASGGINPQLDAAYEAFLAEIVFSSNDPRMDIIDNIDRCGDKEWLDWLNNKAEKSTDPEERVALKDLYEMILDIQKSMEISKLAEERKAKEEAENAAAAQQSEGEEAGATGGGSSNQQQMSNVDVLKKAQVINTATAGGQVGSSQADQEQDGQGKVSFYDEAITNEIRMSYESQLKKVLPPYKAGDTPATIVYAFYDKFDAQFIKVLTERSDNGDDDSTALLEALGVEQQTRLTEATENLKQVLSLGDPNRMFGALVKLAREGKIDEPFLLLLEANATQARDAGATGPAQLMDKLISRANEEKDKQASSKEIKLIRKLLRAADSAEREEILTEAFTPKEQLLVPGTAENVQRAMDGAGIAMDGELTEEDAEAEKPMPDVPPPDFLNACKAVLLNFGNLQSENDDRGDLATRIKTIASEAEVVATKIYGKGMSLREQQDRAWSEQTTSIFDLERMEIEAERQGETAPWANENADDEIVPGFDASGKMRIGGN